MRTLLIAPLAILLLGAGEPQQSPLNNPAYEAPQHRWETIDDAMRQPADVIPGREVVDPENCTDTIVEAREATGQPPLLQREPASPDQPLAIYAVDRTQDGCSVVVMMGDREDIRPLPLPAETTNGLMPAEASAEVE